MTAPEIEFRAPENDADRVNDRHAEIASDRDDKKFDGQTTPSAKRSNPSETDPAGPVDVEKVATATSQEVPTVPLEPAPAAMSVTTSPGILIAAQTAGPALQAIGGDVASADKPSVDKAASHPVPPSALTAERPPVSPTVVPTPIGNVGATDAPRPHTPHPIAPPATGGHAKELTLEAVGGATISAPMTGTATGRVVTGETTAPARPDPGPGGQPTLSPVPLPGAAMSTVSPDKAIISGSADHDPAGAKAPSDDIGSTAAPADRPAVRLATVAAHDLIASPIRTMPETTVPVTSASITGAATAPLGDGLSLPQTTFAPAPAIAAGPVPVGAVGSAPTPASAAQFAQVAPPAVHQIAVQINRAVLDSVDRMTVQLKPAALGHVSIDLEIGHDNRIIAVIAADRADTLDLLQRDAKALERALNEAGVKADSGSLSFNLRGENGQRDFAGFDRNNTIAFKGDTDGTEITSAGTDPHPVQRLATAGGVDIRI